MAAIATIVPVIAVGSLPLSCRSTGASPAAISSRAVSARAVPEQYRSQQPLLPQAQGRPFGTTVR